MVLALAMREVEARVPPEGTGARKTAVPDERVHSDCQVTAGLHGKLFGVSVGIAGVSNEVEHLLERRVADKFRAVPASMLWPHRVRRHDVRQERAVPPSLVAFDVLHVISGDLVEPAALQFVLVREHDHCGPMALHLPYDLLVVQFPIRIIVQELRQDVGNAQRLFVWHALRCNHLDPMQVVPCWGEDRHVLLEVTLEAVEVLRDGVDLQRHLHALSRCQAQEAASEGRCRRRHDPMPLGGD
mmetsp:Transcript_67609/g.209167  ORF Transcript_67609/g.209167 Transcript_67609/m.209167 type:complete len:242 (+) Transcript_67609:539-1264(+)